MISVNMRGPEGATFEFIRDYADRIEQIADSIAPEKKDNDRDRPYLMVQERVQRLGVDRVQSLEERLGLPIEPVFLLSPLQ